MRERVMTIAEATVNGLCYYASANTDAKWYDEMPDVADMNRSAAVTQLWLMVKDETGVEIDPDDATVTVHRYTPAGLDEDEEEEL